MALATGVSSTQHRAPRPPRQPKPPPRRDLTAVLASVIQREQKEYRQRPYLPKAGPPPMRKPPPRRRQKPPPIRIDGRIPGGSPLFQILPHTGIPQLRPLWSDPQPMDPRYTVPEYIRPRREPWPSIFPVPPVRPRRHEGRYMHDVLRALLGEEIPI